MARGNASVDSQRKGNGQRHIDEVVSLKGPGEREDQIRREDCAERQAHAPRIPPDCEYPRRMQLGHAVSRSGRG